MPLCHFVFGRLHREGKFNEQLEAFIEHILQPKRLTAFACPEFMPILNSKNALSADPNSARISNGGLTFERWVQSPAVSLMTTEVYMISFVDIPFKKLRSWCPSSHYGKLGIAFTDKFRNREKVQSVSYYDNFLSLSSDPKVISLNDAIKNQDSLSAEKLRSEVVERRKPARLWPELNSLFAVLKLEMGADGVAVFDKLTYSRYPEGYDFTAEREARIVTGKANTSVSFGELDVLAIVVPDQKTKSNIEEYLRQTWMVVPQILVYPS
jgi:hypothetical protein